MENGGIVLARIEKTIEIKAPVEQVWPMVFWDKVPEWMNQIKKASYTSKYKDQIGATAHVVGEAGGIKSEWEAETTEWTENEKFAWRTTAGTFTGFGSMTLNQIDAGTRATFLMDYDLPYSFLGKLVDKLRVSRDLERGTEKALLKLKELAEGEC
jgi:uncharacterized membrane protein